MSVPDRLNWPAERLAEALEALARRAGYPLPAAPDSSEPAPADADRLDRWLDSACRRLMLEAEPVDAAYGEIGRLLRRAAPALLRLPDVAPSGAGRFLLLSRGGRRRVTLLGTDLKPYRVPLAELVDTLTGPLAAPHRERLQTLLDSAGVAGERRPAALNALLDDRLSDVRIGGCWLLRQSPGGAFWPQLKQARVPLQLGLLVIAHAAQQGLQILGWWLILRGALDGRYDAVWIAAWALVLLTIVPFQLLTLWCQSLITVGVGALLKQRLLFGTLQLRPEEIRHHGIGQFLGRVLEAETLETMMLNGGFGALIAAVELAAAFVVLSFGLAAPLLCALLAGWLLAVAVICWRYYQRNRRWRSLHRLMINDLIERMVGHRTRLAQQAPERWHDDEDRAEAAYFQQSLQLDASAVQLRGVVGRGWLLLALAGLGATLLQSGDIDIAPLAISIGGVMLAARALNTLILGADSLIGVANAWGQIGPLFHAAARVRRRDGGEITADAVTGDRPLLQARGLSFRYRDLGRPVLNDCELIIRRGDRLLLEGGSGGGKSTLAALLTGLRSPSDGLLLFDGLDRRTFGETRWRQQAVAAPQFHENHVLTETLAFNLLMGRRWPPQPDDLREADEVCRELGLGDLLDRMPAGLQQMVGESGWQLSHGERSRLFIARALLQRARLIVLDESFAALDPVNLERALRCVLARAPTLLVIAHP